MFINFEGGWCDNNICSRKIFLWSFKDINSTNMSKMKRNFNVSIFLNKHTLVSPSLESAFRNGLKNLVLSYFTMNALICAVSFQLVAGVLSVWGGVHQTSHFFFSSETFWLYIGLRITGIQDLAHRIVYVLEHSLLGHGSFGALWWKRGNIWGSVRK